MLWITVLILGSAAEALLEDCRGSDNFQEQVSALTSGPSLALGKIRNGGDIMRM